MRIHSIVRAAGLTLSLFLFQGLGGAPCLAGEQSVEQKVAGGLLKPVTITSEPTGASILVNGRFIHKTPFVLEVPVNADGQCTERLQITAEKAPVVIYEETRTFPGIADGKQNQVPSTLFFDLYVQRVVTIR